ncbi:hypothetical protein XA68_14304 [Ophiocordyceps unilateralis]|uniref:Uncharacterized protein n=1 Tax=Ophiocordyceps unilateralis TaxID=268505 RepID=A0A2A9PAS1_OPHUN|nr:hypothetical protein XA68_14304 [Ophiocordyceps unilateralis]
MMGFKCKATQLHETRSEQPTYLSFLAVSVLPTARAWILLDADDAGLATSLSRAPSQLVGATSRPNRNRSPIGSLPVVPLPRRCHAFAKGQSPVGRRLFFGPE